MDDKLMQKIQEVITKAKEDPNLLAEFKKDPSKTIEKVAGVNIPDILEPQINKLAKEGLNGLKADTDPKSIISKFLK